MVCLLQLLHHHLLHLLGVLPHRLLPHRLLHHRLLCLLHHQQQVSGGHQPQQPWHQQPVCRRQLHQWQLCLCCQLQGRDQLLLVLPLWLLRVLLLLCWLVAQRPEADPAPSAGG